MIELHPTQIVQRDAAERSSAPAWLRHMRWLRDRFAAFDPRVRSAALFILTATIVVVLSLSTTTTHVTVNAQVNQLTFTPTASTALQLGEMGIRALHVEGLSTMREGTGVARPVVSVMLPAPGTAAPEQSLGFGELPLRAGKPVVFATDSDGRARITVPNPANVVVHYSGSIATSVESDEGARTTALDRVDANLGLESAREPLDMFLTLRDGPVCLVCSTLPIVGNSLDLRKGNPTDNESTRNLIVANTGAIHLSGYPDVPLADGRPVRMRASAVELRRVEFDAKDGVRVEFDAAVDALDELSLGGERNLLPSWLEALRRSWLVQAWAALCFLYALVQTFVKFLARRQR